MTYRCICTFRYISLIYNSFKNINVEQAKEYFIGNYCCPVRLCFSLLYCFLIEK